MSLARAYAATAFDGEDVSIEEAVARAVERNIEKSDAEPDLTTWTRFNGDESHSDEECLVARGDSLLDVGEEAGLRSPLPKVSDEQWTAFVKKMVTADVGAVSESNALGMFEMTPRRLADLGYLTEPVRVPRIGSKRMIWVARFVGTTPEEFLSDKQAQYDAFERSMLDYDEKMDRGEIARPLDLSRSGALAVLHRAGPSGLASWERGERFSATEALCKRVEGVF